MAILAAGEVADVLVAATSPYIVSSVVAPGPDHVVAVSALEFICAVATFDVVIAFLSMDEVSASVSLETVPDRVASVVIAVDPPVVTWSPIDRVGAATAPYTVIAALGINMVCAGASLDVVGTVRSVDGVVIRRSDA